jgi:glycerol uptake facilitator-like aquaporin
LWVWEYISPCTVCNTLINSTLKFKTLYTTNEFVYIVCVHSTGGLVGIGFLKIITPKIWYGNCFAANAIQDGLTVGHAFFAEYVLTFFLMLVVMAACDSNKSNQTLVPLAIGMAVFVAHMLLLPVTGCSINPTVCAVLLA